MSESRIGLSEVLAELDEKILPNGKPKIHSVKFINSKGEVVYLHRCISSGAGKMNMSANALRGFQPISKDLKKEGHPYPVKIWHIIEFNGKKVTLK